MLLPIALFPMITLAGALLLDLVLGDPPNSIHPVAWMGRFIESIWRFRSRPDTAHLKQFVFGACLVLLGVAAFGLPWIILHSVIPLYWLLSIPFLKVCLSVRGLLRAGKQIRKALEQGDLEQARSLLKWHLVSRATAGLSETQVTAAAIESLAENITDGLTSPLFYFALFGLPGAWIYRFVNTCDSMLGYRDIEHEYTGKFAAWLDTFLNWIPARITGVLIVLAALPAGEDASQAWRIMLSQNKRTTSHNAGWTMAAAAGALGVTLEKVGHYSLKGGEGPLDADTIKRALKLVCWTVLFVVVFSLLLTGGLYACFT